jgi:transcriptional regulator with XRE-family HTH domain
VDPLEDQLAQPGGLADRLRLLRTRAGLSGKQLADTLGWQASKVSRLENARQVPSPTDLASWGRACGADGDAVHALLEQLEDFQGLRSDFKRRVRGGQELVQLALNRITAEAQARKSFQTVLVPGMLQTAAYARRVLAEMGERHGSPVDDVEQAVAARLARQQYLYDPAKTFEFLLAEPVLLWRPCPPEDMRGQLDRLQTVIGLPNVRFGIIPLSAQIATIPQNAFNIIDDTVLVENFVGEERHVGEQAASYARILERLWADAVEGEAARPLIIAAADRLR